MYHQPQTHEVREIRLKDGQLIVWGDTALNPRSADRFQIGEFPGFVVFKRDASGKIIGHTIEPNEQAHPYFEKVSTPEMNAEMLSAYVGRYASDELATFYDVVLEDGKLVLRHLRHADALLTPTYADAFKAAGYAEVVFGRDTSGQVQTFTFYTTRVRGIRLYRE